MPPTMRTLDETHRVEVAKWDELALRHHADERLRVPDRDFAAYARRCQTMPGVAEFLGDLRGVDVLEYGCGLGYVTTLLALSGARVWAFDLSPAAIDVTRRRARLHGVEESVRLDVAAGEQLPYPEGRFDRVFGKAVLHHLDVGRAPRELHRVMAPGGRAVFA
jgi:SAM-dependent methyltransferase